MMKVKTVEFGAGATSEKKLTTKEKISMVNDENTTDDVLLEFATDKDASVRVAIAKRKLPLSIRVLDILVADTFLFAALAQRDDLPENVKDILVASGRRVGTIIEGIVERLAIRRGWDTFWRDTTFDSLQTYYHVDKEFWINGVLWQFAQRWKVKDHGVVPKEAMAIEDTFRVGDRIRVTYQETEDMIEVTQIEKIDPPS
jgi:hypothetical protein